MRTVRDRVKGGEVGQIKSIKTTARDAPFPPLEYLRISGDYSAHLWQNGVTPENEISRK